MLTIFSKTKNEGFTLFEALIAITFFIVVIFISTTMFIMAQDIYSNASKQSELIQNVRVSLDRISRELRQSNEVITDFSGSATSSEIFFQDGHNNLIISYIDYYASSTDLMRKHLVYEFSSNPGTYVYYNSIDAFAQPPDEIILEDRLIGEYFDEIEFSMNQGLVNIYLNLSKNSRNFEISTKVFVRNW